MSGLTSFFLFCSGANATILKRSPTDHHKYVSIGATIFFTGLFAAIAGGFALHAVFKSVWVAIPFGLLWGMMIFNLDRYIVMSLKKKGSKLQELGSALPRLVLAVIIAIVIAKPLELKLFDSEIQAELVLMEQAKFGEQERALKLRFEADIKEAKSDLTLLEFQIETKRTKRDELNELAIQEADGTGGSGQKNLGPIYNAKKKDADLAQTELNATLAELTPQMEEKLAIITSIEATKSAELAAMEKTRLDGFAARLDALGRLADKSSTIFWASIFITLLFIAIETAPLFVKLISSRSPYDYRLHQHEEEVALQHLNVVGKLSAATKADLKYHGEAERFQSLEALNAEKTVIKKVIETELGSMADQALTWKDYKAMGRKFS